jgi:hypothetical protein
MKIGISINEVLRDFIGQFAYTYDKYIAATDITNKDITSFNLIDFFKFESVDQLNSFLYLEAPLEIFGHADQMSDGLINHFNEFLSEMDYDGEHEIELVSREVNKAIPSTLFFLSKTGCRASNIRFVKTYESKWDGLDVLITANPKSLESKPSGKISVKVKTNYNTDVKADYEIDSILEFMKDDELRNKILSQTITTTYEEIN